MNENKRILIATGGGGHFSPALSVIDELPKNAQVLVVGRKYALEGDNALSLEYQTAAKLGIPFMPIISGRLQRKFTVQTLPSLLKFPLGVIGAVKTILEFKPDLVLSFGGYVSLPVVFAASLFRIPIIIHEQTLGAGLSNRIASVFAKKICISWESSKKFFPKDRTVLTGNPVKKFKVQSSEVKIEDNLPVLFITGGSSGSHAINMLIEQCIKRLVEKMSVVHQTGDSQEFKDFERLVAVRNSLPKELKSRYVLTKFIPPGEFGWFLSKADLVVCRAGMNTVSELLYFGKPALLIPLPFSQGSEQLQNAQFVADLGIGAVFLQKELTTAMLEQNIYTMLQNKNEFVKKGKAAKKLVVENAAENIIRVIKECITLHV